MRDGGGTLFEVERVVAAQPMSLSTGTPIGKSREGRPIYGFALGSGPLGVSLIAGCHADEPVGQQTLFRLISYLATLRNEHPLLKRWRWRIVPNANPDGAERNAAWSLVLRRGHDFLGVEDSVYDLSAYLREVVREPPPDDIEFGFPKDPHDTRARPENLAVAAFLGAGGPYQLHGSLHGMGLSPGPWFLIERGWTERTTAMRSSLRTRVHEMGYRLFDPDRGGEKGFHRIDGGFTSRPDSAAMSAYFVERNDPAMASRFRPSSMEYVRSLGGDPLTLVSEMPLFLTRPLTAEPSAQLAELAEVRRRAAQHTEDHPRDTEKLDIRPMPIRDQMRLQLAFIGEAMAAASAERSAL